MLKRGLVNRQPWRPYRELMRELAHNIDRWYNQEPRRSTLGYISPARYEQLQPKAARLGVHRFWAAPLAYWNRPLLQWPWNALYRS